MKHDCRRLGVELVVGALVAFASLTLLTGAPVSADPTGELHDLIDAVAQRLQVADPVAANKWLTGGPITDPPRAQQILESVAAEAQSDGVSADYVRHIFTDQINATEAIQYTRFAHWKFDGSTAPTTAPDLSASRSSIDALNHQMVNQIAANWSLLNSPLCAAEIDAAKATVADARQFDPLFREALDSATRSYCSG